MSFLILSSLSIKFFSFNSFWSYVKYTPSALIGISGHLIPKYSCLLSFNDPIYIPSVFEQLILRPEMLRNRSSSSNNTLAELVSANIAMVSSAYRKSFVSYSSIKIPLMSEFCLMAMASVSTATTNRYGDSGSPCRTPRSSVKKLEVIPLFKIQLCIFF